MQIDTPYFPLSRAPAVVERITGERPSVATCFRWRQRGLRGVRLRTIFAVGGHRTTEAWLHEFFAAVAAADNGPLMSDAASATRQSAIDRAAAELEAAGI